MNLSKKNIIKNLAKNSLISNNDASGLFESFLEIIKSKSKSKSNSEDFGKGVGIDLLDDLIQSKSKKYVFLILSALCFGVMQNFRSDYIFLFIYLLFIYIFQNFWI